MSFPQALKFTDLGKKIQLRGVSGESLVFTTVRMGDGELSKDISVMTSLVNERTNVAVNKVAVNSKYATIEAIFKNNDLTEGFFWRELGIYVANPDAPDDRDSDILYAYQNAGGLAEYINAPGSSVIEKIIRIPVFIGETENISVNVNSIVEQEATATQEEGYDIDDDDYFTFYDSDKTVNKKIPFSIINNKIQYPIKKNIAGLSFGLCNLNIIPNILPLADNVDKNITTASTTIASVNLLSDTVSWILKLNATNTAWKILLGDIGEGTDDANYGGVSTRYIGYHKPADAGGQCYGLYIKLSAPECAVFPAGEYTLSYWLCIEGSDFTVPLLRTAVPTEAMQNGGLSDITKDTWQKISKTFTIESNTSELCVVLDSTSPSQASSRKLRFADIKLEYGSVATRFNPDCSKEKIMNALAYLLETQTTEEGE